MTSKNSAHAKLIAVSGMMAANTSRTEPADFVQKMLLHPDPKEAATIVGEQAGLLFDQSANGQELAQLSTAQPELESSFKTSKLRQEQLEDKLKNTSQFIKCADLRGGTDTQNQTRTSFLQWSGRDQIAMVMLGTCLIAAMVMGAANVFSNLISSGQPIFLEHPWMAIAISTLIPAGSCAIKFIGNFFEFSLSKKRFALFIYSATSLVLLVWSGLFAHEFTGVTGGLDVESMINSSSTHSGALVWVQLVAEILVAAALFIAAEDIAFKYAPECYRENPDYLNTINARNQHLTAHNALRDQRGQAHARMVVLQATRTIAINEAVADFMVKSRRFHSLNQL